MSTEFRIVTIGVLFLTKFASGLWLSRAGKPHNAALLTVHKLISLLTVVLIAFLIRHLRRGVGLSGVEMGAIAVTGLLFLTGIVTGGLVSLEKPAHVVVSIAHKVAPYLSVISTAVMFYLMWGRS